MLGGGLPIYHIERTVLELKNALFGGKSHIIYVNGAYEGEDETDLNWLIHDFRCTDAADMHFQELAERVRYYKEDSEGIKTMCKIMKDIEEAGREKGREEVQNEMMAKMFSKGYTDEQVADIVDKTIDEVEKLRGQLCL